MVVNVGRPSLVRKLSTAPEWKLADAYMDVPEILSMRVRAARTRSGEVVGVGSKSNFAGSHSPSFVFFGHAGTNRLFLSTELTGTRNFPSAMFRVGESAVELGLDCGPHVAPPVDGWQVPRIEAVLKGDVEQFAPRLMRYQWERFPVRQWQADLVGSRSGERAPELRDARPYTPGAARHLLLRSAIYMRDIDMLNFADEQLLKQYEDVTLPTLLHGVPIAHPSQRVLAATEHLPARANSLRAWLRELEEVIDQWYEPLKQEPSIVQSAEMHMMGGIARLYLGERQSNVYDLDSAEFCFSRAAQDYIELELFDAEVQARAAFAFAESLRAAFSRRRRPLARVW